MMLYGLTMSMLVEQIWGEYLIFIQSCYPDDFSIAGAGPHLKPEIAHIEAMGPVHGFLFESEKS